jgi:AraC family transcriptional regulator
MSETADAQVEALADRVIECSPYPIQVYDPDGTSVYLNPALLNEGHVTDRNAIIGKYNVLVDPAVRATGQLHVLKKALEGETVSATDIRVPLEDISRRYGVDDFDVEAVYQDVTVFPLKDVSERVTHVVALLINSRVYRGEAKIEKAKEYLDNHWLSKYDAGQVAKVADLSKAHLSRLFKKHTGMTVQEYHARSKIQRLKERLLDPNLSVAEAFASCNMTYNGHSARLFRDKVGVSPSEYREEMKSTGGKARDLRSRVEDWMPGPVGVTEPPPRQRGLLRRTFESFPYPIQIFSLDGTARLVNNATLQAIGIKSRESHVGKYNVFRDPIVRDLGAVDRVRQAREGKIVHLMDFNASYPDMIRHFGLVDRDIEMIRSDITCFPILSAEGMIEAFAALFMIRRVYWGREEIERGKQYIEDHWREPFDANEAAKAACLSRSHFAKLFKKRLGLTPHQHYIDYKIGRLKEKLLDANLSVAEAFAACNMDYNSHSSRLFKQKVGVTPSAYQQNYRDNAKVEDTD